MDCLQAGSLNRVPILILFRDLTLIPGYVAFWVENPFFHLSAQTIDRLAEANIHMSLEEEGIFPRQNLFHYLFMYFV